MKYYSRFALRKASQKSLMEQLGFIFEINISNNIIQLENKYFIILKTILVVDKSSLENLYS